MTTTISRSTATPDAVAPDAAIPDGTDPDLASQVGPRGLSGGRRWAVFAALLLIVAVAIVGTRVALVRPAARTAVVSVGHPAALVPASPSIEAAWGIRFTDVILVADGGGVELRYQVIDLGRAEKIHLGDPTSNELPTIEVDGTSARVTPSAVLMHFHHGDSADGRSYSIVYGNAGGVVRTGEFVTIVMKDGAMLRHAQVSD